MDRALQSRACQGSRAPGHKKRVKITAGSGGPRHVLFQACREGYEKHCWGLDWSGADSNMFCARTPKLAERGMKNIAGGFGGAGLQWGADRFIYARRFCLSSTRHRKVVQNPQATEREREVVVNQTLLRAWWGGLAAAIKKWSRTPTLSKLTHMIISCGDLSLVGSTDHRKVVQT